MTRTPKSPCCNPGSHSLPPFLIPILAFLLWALAIFSYFPAFKIDTLLSDQLLASQLFVSQLILIYAWAFSGPVTAIALTVLCALVALYLALAAKEPAIFLEVFIYVMIFISMVYYLHKIQKQTNDKQIAKEKLTEEIHLTREELAAKRQLKDAFERKIDRLLDLRRYSERLKNISQLEEAAKEIVREVRGALDQADQCVLYLVDESRQELTLVASDHRHPPDGSVKEKEGTVFDRWVMKHSQGLVIEDTLNDFRFSTETRGGPEPLRSVCVSPLVSERRVLGVVRVSSADPRVFTTEDLRLTDIFSSLGAVSLRNILLSNKMGELAIRDSLTGLYLNRYFQERLSEEIQRALGSKSSFSLILMDIDHFKRYNDDYGHSAGDIVLKNIAATLSRCLEPADLAARYGGEEFAVILPDKGKPRALELAEKIRAEIERSRFSIRRAETLVTASFGVASFGVDGRTREDLIRHVDRNLYEAKGGGRNRVCGNT